MEHAILLAAHIWVGLLLLAAAIIWFVLVRRVALDFVEKRRDRNETR